MSYNPEIIKSVLPTDAETCYAYMFQVGIHLDYANSIGESEQASRLQMSLQHLRYRYIKLKNLQDADSLLFAYVYESQFPALIYQSKLVVVYTPEIFSLLNERSDIKPSVQTESSQVDELTVIDEELMTSSTIVSEDQISGEVIDSNDDAVSCDNIVDSDYDPSDYHGIMQQRQPVIDQPLQGKIPLKRLKAVNWDSIYPVSHFTEQGVNIASVISDNPKPKRRARCGAPGQLKCARDGPIVYGSNRARYGSIVHSDCSVSTVYVGLNDSAISIRQTANRLTEFERFKRRIGKGTFSGDDPTLSVIHSLCNAVGNENQIKDQLFAFRLCSSTRDWVKTIELRDTP